MGESEGNAERTCFVRPRSQATIPSLRRLFTPWRQVADTLIAVHSPLALRSPRRSAAGFRHAFFTRLGGFSLPPFHSLNFASHVGDDPASVARNLSIAAKDLNVDAQRILFLKQVHGIVTHLAAPPLSLDETEKWQGDALIAREPSIACGVRIADCAPILMADPVSGFVAAIHSGWRGTEQNITGHVIDTLRDHGCHAHHLIAAVGPHIERCCFETGHDVAARLSRASPVHDVLHLGPRGRPHVDLRRILHAQLLQAGVRPNQIDHVRGCTVCDSERFFSYRRDGSRSGRLLAAIVPRKT